MSGELTVAFACVYNVSSAVNLVLMTVICTLAIEAKKEGSSNCIASSAR